jgi:hypothetical protein
MLIFVCNAIFKRKRMELIFPYFGWINWLKEKKNPKYSHKIWIERLLWSTVGFNAMPWDSVIRSDRCDELHHEFLEQ